MSNTEKKLRYHITITDNWTGETVDDQDFNIFIGGIGYEESGSARVLSECNAFDYAFAVMRAEEAIREAYEDHPELKMLVAGLSKMEEKIDNEEEKGE